MITWKFSKKQVENGKKISKKEWEEAKLKCSSCKSEETGYYRTNCDDCCGTYCWHEKKNGRVIRIYCCACWAKKGYNKECPELKENNVPADTRIKLMVEELRKKFWSGELKLFTINKKNSEDERFNKVLFVKNNSEIIYLNYYNKNLKDKEEVCEREKAITYKKHCPSCDRLEYLEQCDTCKREFCIETCLGLYHGSEKLWCKDCFDKQSTKEKVIMLSKNKKNSIRK